VDLAVAAVRHEVGLRVTPVGQGLRPLGGPLQVEDVVARFDEGAVDDARSNGRHFAGGDGHHRFVEQGQAFVRAPQPHERLAAAHAGERQQIGIGEAAADVGGPTQGLARGEDVTLFQLAHAGEEQQVADLDAVTLRLLHQPLGSP